MGKFWPEIRHENGMHHSRDLCPRRRCGGKMTITLHRGGYTFARMSGMLDLSMDENATCPPQAA